jgi:hypothetical protein
MKLQKSTETRRLEPTQYIFKSVRPENSPQQLANEAYRIAAKRFLANPYKARVKSS